jgi:hypothetical protein
MFLLWGYKEEKRVEAWQCTPSSDLEMDEGARMREEREVLILPENENF